VTKGRWLAACSLIAAVAVLRVASTHRVFSAVVDEPIHIAAGHQWWLGEPAWDALHPPLAKLLFAAALRNTPPPAAHDRAGYAFELLYARADAVRTLARARMGNLVFLLIAFAAVVAWARRYGDGVALLAGALFASLPPILGHAGLATTDMAVAAMLPVALLALDRWLRQPTTGNALLLGTAMGAGALTKYSFLLFFLVCGLVLIACARQEVERRTSVRRVRRFALALLTAILILWAGYRFQFAPLATFRSVTMPPASTLSPPMAWLYTRVPIPAPSFFGGLVILKWYNLAGRPAFLLGQVSDKGWWYYFPVVFFFKTPLPFLLLAVAGAAVLMGRREPALLLMPLALMLAAMRSSINIGVRHILPIYPLLCIVAAVGAAALWKRWKAATAILLAWLFIGTAVAHPDYLAWFNEAAGRHPERIAVDSNLDWGQDMLRLARLARRRGIPSIAMNCVSAMPFARFGVPDRPLPPFTPVTGWVAVSETALALSERGAYAWLDGKPYERVGRSIRLYRIATPL
jgi:hypothetical protein